MSTMQEVYDVTLKLQSAEQQISILKLQKIEYEKEIMQLKTQNEELSKQQDSYIENEKHRQQYISLLQSLVSDTNEIDSNNFILNEEICKYQKLLKNFTLQNTKLQAENEKHRIKLHQLNQQKQKTDNIYKNNTLHLENIIKQLQNQCDELQEEINTFNVLNMRNKQSTNIDEKQYEFPLLSLPKTPSLTFDKYKMRSISVCTENMETEIMSNIEDNSYDIMSQLIEFGYNKNEIIIAMNMVNDSTEITVIIEIIKNNKREKYKYFKTILSEIIETKIDMIVDTAKSHINKLSERIKLLQKENCELKLNINKTN